MGALYSVYNKTTRISATGINRGKTSFATPGRVHRRTKRRLVVVVVVIGMLLGVFNGVVYKYKQNTSTHSRLVPQIRN